MTSSRIDVPGWGVDARAEDRPGVPRELDPPRPLAPSDPRAMGRQHSVPSVLVDPGKTMTPVYSSANPPRGLSGALRRLAYRIPTYRTRRWMLLLLADRVDVLEHGGRRPIAKLAGGLAMFALGYFAVRALRNA